MAVSRAVKRVAVRLGLVAFAIVVFSGKIPSADFVCGERAGLYLTGVVGFIGASSASSAKHRVGVVYAGIDHRNPDSLPVKAGFARAPSGLGPHGWDAFFGEQPIRPWAFDPHHAGELGQVSDGFRGNSDAQRVDHPGEPLGHSDAIIS